jgi:tRNA A37 methylthiotransferase MiaB
VNADLIAALRETPTAGRHLHVPLQSGDDGVLRAMGRRYTAATYLRRLAGLDDFNLTADVIVGFPAEDEAAFERTVDVVGRAASRSSTSFLLAQAGTRRRQRIRFRRR